MSSKNPSVDFLNCVAKAPVSSSVCEFRVEIEAQKFHLRIDFEPLSIHDEYCYGVQGFLKVVTECGTKANLNEENFVRKID